MLPGIYLTVTGPVLREHREMAALLHSGANGLLTGWSAVRHHGLAAPESINVHVLVPLNIQRQSIDFARLHRTKRMPDQHEEAGPIRYAKASRAVADTARDMTKLDDVRSLVYEAVQRRTCTITDLFIELDSGPTRRCSLLRTVLTEVATGIRSHAEKDLQALITRAKLPEPMYNAKLFTLDGEFIAMVDTWWGEAATAGEVDSRAYHTSIVAQDRDRNRHTKLITHGVYPMHFSPYKIRKEASRVVSEIRTALERNRRMVPLPIVAVGPDQRWTIEAADEMRERIATAQAAAGVVAVPELTSP